MWGKSRNTNQMNITQIGTAQLADIIRESGFKAKVEHENDGGSFISSASNGYNTAVTMCGDNKGGEFSSFQFVLYLQNPDRAVTLDTINRFNGRWRYAKSLLTVEGDTICLQMDVDLDGGVSQDYIAKRIALWDNLVGAFRAFLTT